MDDNTGMSGPFATIPDEILSLIFIEVCIEQWWAALALGSVCSHWRSALLSTPRAWACLEITPYSQIFNPNLLDLWLSRCGAIKLHISLNSFAEPVIVEVVCFYEDIIKCLSLFNNSKQLMHQFPQLEELRLGPDDCFLSPKSSIERTREIMASELTEEDIQFGGACLVDVQRFPKLVSLHLHSPSIYTMEAIARKLSFPPLQELHIHATRAQWLQIIDYSAETLVTLAIEIPKNSFNFVSALQGGRSSIILPYLQKLSYVIHGYLDPLEDLGLPSFKTPSLETYHERSLNHAAPLHVDTSSVTSVCLQHAGTVNWAAFPALACLQLVSDEGSIILMLTPLGDNPGLCPDLSWVECIPLGIYSELQERLARQALQRRSNATGKSIVWKYMESEVCPAFSMCFTFCNCDTNSEAQLDEYDEEEKEDGDIEYSGSESHVSFYSSDDSDGGRDRCPFCGARSYHDRGTPCSCLRWGEIGWRYNQEMNS